MGRGLCANHKCPVFPIPIVPVVSPCSSVNGSGGTIRASRPSEWSGNRRRRQSNARTPARFVNRRCSRISVGDGMQERDDRGSPPRRVCGVAGSPDVHRGRRHVGLCRACLGPGFDRHWWAKTSSATLQDDPAKSWVTPHNGSIVPLEAIGAAGRGRAYNGPIRDPGEQPPHAQTR